MPEPKKSLRKKLMKREGRMIKWELSHLDKVFLVVVGSIGFILFWKGIVIVIETTPLLRDPVVLILSGLFIMLLTGWVIKSGALRVKE